MRKRKFNLIVLIVLFLFFIAGIVGAAFSYWAGTVNAPTATLTKEVTVTVGSGSEVSTTLTLDENNSGTLVPAGKAQTGQVEYIISTITASWKEDGSSLATGHKGTLTATVSNVKIDGATTNADLVVTAVQIGGTVTDGTFDGNGSATIALDGASLSIYVKVTLLEPSTPEVYQAVAGKTITFDVTCEVAPSSY